MTRGRLEVEVVVVVVVVVEEKKKMCAPANEMLAVRKVSSLCILLPKKNRLQLPATHSHTPTNNSDTDTGRHPYTHTPTHTVSHNNQPKKKSILQRTKN